MGNQDASSLTTWLSEWDERGMRVMGPPGGRRREKVAHDIRASRSQKPNWLVIHHLLGILNNGDEMHFSTTSGGGPNAEVVRIDRHPARTDRVSDSGLGLRASDGDVESEGRAFH
ncbi:hypothetical protein XA68_16912 [Ophiocordyceps unilateralis]|uniref:Uncharacterized protein n=1 Tax=Ophiocordyceps unilateralis TaxID=268505 RepID=A0A2A9P5P3_OPHUN|nr:hypothetical protein XA68_16912 [Ophiocordyceps unilateralis]